ncbi:SMP-30/gluconolactonase/LRE family protein, partial [Candidatus Latescibacterota bacterium]
KHRTIVVICTFILSGFLWADSCFTQTEQKPFNLDKKVAEKLVAGAPEQIATGFKFTEGPAADRDGTLYFTDSHHGVIYTWSRDTGLEIYHDNRFLTVGLAIDKNGRVLACEDNMILDSEGNFMMYDGPSRRLVAIDGNGVKTMVFDSYGGKKLNGLNDIWIAPDGGIYVTDPDWGREGMEQGTSQVLYFPPDRSRLVRVIDDIPITNGVMGSPDGKTLYVIDAENDDVFAWDINKDGTVSGKRLFSEVGVDGMTVDESGNLYVTDTGITIYSPDGKKLETIELPERPTNLCFGGVDGKTLFITASTSVYAVPMNVRGVGWK